MATRSDFIATIQLYRPRTFALPPFAPFVGCGSPHLPRRSGSAGRSVGCASAHTASVFGKIVTGNLQGRQMRLLPADPAIRGVWKTFPVRFEGPRVSRCCSWPTVLVQSMDGGFVTSNCSKCGKYETLSRAEFDDLAIWMACPECGDP